MYVFHDINLWNCIVWRSCFFQCFPQVLLFGHAFWMNSMLSLEYRAFKMSCLDLPKHFIVSEEAWYFGNLASRNCSLVNIPWTCQPISWRVYLLLSRIRIDWGLNDSPFDIILLQIYLYILLQYVLLIYRIHDFRCYCNASYLSKILYFHTLLRMSGLGLRSIINPS